MDKPLTVLCVNGESDPAETGSFIELHKAGIFNRRMRRHITSQRLMIIQVLISERHGIQPLR
jgi:hypothetical protein